MGSTIDAVTRGDIIYKEHAQRYTTKEAVALAKETVDMVLEGQGTSTPVMSKRDAKEAIKEYKGEHPLTGDQKEAVSLALTSSDQFLAIYGFAGTGKSTLFAALKEISGTNLEGLAFTGKAASGLSESAGINAQTVAQHLTKNEGMKQRTTYIIGFFKDYSGCILSFPQKKRMAMR